MEAKRSVSSALQRLAIRASLYALILSSAAGAVLPPSTAVERSYFGLHIHRAEVSGNWPGVNFGSWRLWDANVAWPSLEPSPGRWDFQRLDRYVAIAEAHGVELLLPLALTPTWASARPEEPSAYRRGNAAEPLDMNDWRRYVRTVAERYKGRIRHYEVWNEPSDRRFFTGDVESMVALAREAYQILKTVDPGNQLVSPGMAGGGGHLRYLEAFLAKGGRHFIDVVGYHFYVWKSGPEAIIPLIRQVRQIMARQGVEALPLWNTETGWWVGNSDGTPDPPTMTRSGWKRLDPLEEAGAYLARALILARSEGLARFYWYAWDNTGMGMLDPASKQPKPMVRSYESVFEWLVGGDVTDCAATLGVWSCRLGGRAGHSGWIAWVEGGDDVDWELPRAWGGGLVAEGLDGSAVAVTSGRVRLRPVPVRFFVAPNGTR